MSQPLLSPPSSSSTPLSSNPVTPPDAAPVCTPEHALYCFDVLSAHFEGRPPIAAPFDNHSEAFALFVTWNTISHRRTNGKPALRGCIGNFRPMPLGKGLREYALVSALEDERFPPIKAAELPELQCAVSVLTPFMPIPDPLAWIPGQHGIHISFPHPKDHRRSLSATYLPEIASDMKWTREETIFSAIQKAGYRHTVRVGDDVWRSLKVRVYGSEKAGVTWAHYTRWKAGSKGEQAGGQADEDPEAE